MKRHLALLLGLGCGLAGPVASAQTTGVGRLSWLAGCWAPSAAAAGSAEHWMAPGQLQARIEGLRHGAPRGADFPMTRVACGAR